MEKIIESYIKNTISEDELNILREWVSKEGNAIRFKEMIHKYYQDHPFDPKKSFKVFESQTFDKDKKVYAFPKNGKKRFSFIKYAAIFVGMATTGYFMYQMNPKPVKTAVSPHEVTLEVEGMGTRILNTSDHNNIKTDNGSVLAEQNGNILDYRTTKNSIAHNILKVPYGKTFHVHLSDGTHVYLNAGSILRYPSKFIEGRIREVFLEGEGYFKVTKNGEWPFIVRGTNMNAEVFGTEFNVSSYSEDPKSKIVLVEGSVGVFEGDDRFNARSDFLLSPNEMASKTNMDRIHVSPVDVSSHIAWIDGALLFKNERFTSIAKKLERHYNVRIVNNYMALGEKKFTGRFDIETVDQVLTAFQKTNKFTYIRKGDEIIINL